MDLYVSKEDFNGERYLEAQIRSGNLLCSAKIITNAPEPYLKITMTDGDLRRADPLIIKKSDLHTIKTKFRERSTSTLFFENDDGPYRMEWIRNCLHISKYGDGRKMHVPGCILDKFTAAVIAAHTVMRSL